jgi:site-specific DNA recombinase
MSKSKKHFKVCAYVRVSTEEQAESPEGSIKNQEERIRQAVRHRMEAGESVELVEVFIDAGLSAKDMKRPALQRMLNKIKLGEINLVMVTELSRLSRNTKDFCEMWEFLEDHGCEFQSLREHFDTTNAAGVLMLKSLANFAEFERRQTAERISASFKVRAERGLYNGGPVPFGYRPPLDRSGKLAVHAEEALIVQAAFQAFLDGESLSTAAKWLNANGYKLRREMDNGGQYRLGHFMVSTLHNILSNKAYAGIKVFKTKEGKKEVPAVWEAIVDETTFNRVQEKLAKNFKTRKKTSSASRYPYLLSGMISCGSCGETLCGKSAHGKNRKYPFYEHSRITKMKGTLAKQIYDCQPHRFAGEVVETKVWEAVIELLQTPTIACEIIKQAKLEHGARDYSQEVQTLKNKQYQLQGRLNALTERLSEMPKEMDAGPIYEQMRKIQVMREELDLKLKELNLKNQNFAIPAELGDYQNFLEAIKKEALKAVTPELKRKILTKLVEKVELLSDGMRVHFVVSSGKIKKELDKTGSSFNRTKNNLVQCSNSLTNGGGGGNRTRVRKTF